MKFPIRFLALLCLFFVPIACGDGSDRRRVTIRLIHAVPDGIEVDVYVSGQNPRLFENIAYATSTSFRSLKPGTYTFTLRASGSPSNSTPLLVSKPIMLPEPGTTWTLVFAGLASAPAADPDELRVLALQHMFDPTRATDAVVRIVHAAPGEPVLDLEVRDLGETDSYVGLEPYTATDGEGIAITPSFVAQMLIRDNVSSNLLTTLSAPALPDLGEFFLVLLGSLSEPADTAGGFQMLIADNSGAFNLVLQNPRVSILNTVADATAIDGVYRNLDINGDPINLPMPLDTTIGFGELGGDAGTSLFFPPGEYEFTFFVAGGTAVIGSAKTGPLMAGGQYLAVVEGRADETWPFNLQVVRDMFDRGNHGTASENRWRVLHAAPDLTSVFFGEVINTIFQPLPEFPDAISYGDSTEPLGIDMGTSIFSLVIARQNMVDQFGIWDIVPVPDGLEFVILAGSIDGVSPEPRLFFVDTSEQPWTIASQLPR